MKLKDLYEEDLETLEIAAPIGAGYKDKENKTGRDKLSSYLLRRKSEKNNPRNGDDTAPDDTTTDKQPGDDPYTDKGPGFG